MHLKRWLTSIVLIPLAGSIIAYGPTPLVTLFVGLVALCGLWEYFGIIAPKTPDHLTRTRWILAALSGIFAVVLLWAALENGLALMPALFWLNLMAAGFITILHFKGASDIWVLSLKQIAGLLYIPLPLAYLVMIHGGPAGWQWIFFTLAIVFAGDIGAYYVGSYLGRRKLCPAVSPNKTVEGALGGIGANLIAGACFKQLFFPDLSWPLSLVFFVALGITGQVGDLFESQLKRGAGVKDSGRILPGHGGCLDRIDALLFAAPVAYYFKIYAF